ncbi:hypothetical protein C8J56DRAFT_499421 [Mycena floridula]|nr:hypothetical protein C8J56DRAFT_499421 [Mycena floridula]
MVKPTWTSTLQKFFGFFCVASPATATVFTHLMLPRLTLQVSTLLSCCMLCATPVAILLSNFFLIACNQFFHAIIFTVVFEVALIKIPISFCPLPAPVELVGNCSISAPGFQRIGCADTSPSRPHPHWRRLGKRMCQNSKLDTMCRFGPQADRQLSELPKDSSSSLTPQNYIACKQLLSWNLTLNMIYIHLSLTNASYRSP